MAPASLYDLVVTGRELQYVAKAANGKLKLTSTSTGPTAHNVNGRELVTTIFTVDCHGQIGIVNEGILYSLKIDLETAALSFSPGLTPQTAVSSHWTSTT
ncbi:hypothetical protein CLAFUW4_10057 [Fulvia fulva]|uniref:Uncharacterized protein n=1 Tax=Passalora fulva TaxID=5499 RepID=A0A9Q8PHE5_PASFU|nr:uncharacterized protein CLAFUR5_12187 [Fulvia fulva]KAK4616156.1 hypothetical protein CLAFUR4_10061 [Fulvia fulva]KAK4616415.1 hypothetical protein CLAFUR0_10059 [Fulvia fulva]UJO22477.1 hypothetical protein CLAFUR5_12187 [Fulvia fulva]WPV19345.1 hypothetical protein CLAFUW4_10057 [Fulvia fulva]WPV34133.1 hypothetical protein CLAFUW7_10058 [Fulvia fulva]